MTFYALRVVPDQIALFYSTVGDSEGTTSQLASLRKFVHDQDEDTLLTKIGYRLDLVMNSMYHCLLYTLNICMLYTSDSVTDILLNSLAIEFVKDIDAIEFVKDIDESFTRTGWYDTDYRYLKAGAVEMVVRRYVDFHELDRLMAKSKQSKGKGEGKEGEEAGGEGKEEGQVELAAAVGAEKGLSDKSSSHNNESARSMLKLKRHTSDRGAGVVSLSSRGSKRAASSSKGELADEVDLDAASDLWTAEEEAEDDAATLEAFDYTARPHRHFYGLVNWLRGIEDRATLAALVAETKAEAAAAASTSCSWSCCCCCWGFAHGFVAWIARWLRWLLPFSSERPIFEKFGEAYANDEVLEREWGRLVYAKQTAKESCGGFEFLSVEKTRERLQRVKDITTKADWADALAGAGGDFEELRVLKSWQKRTAYSVPASGQFVSGVAHVLTFADLPKQLKKAVNCRQPLASAAKVLFYLGFGGLNWVAVLVQLCFPVVFAGLFVFVSACY